MAQVTVTKNLVYSACVFDNLFHYPRP